MATTVNGIRFSPMGVLVGDTIVRRRVPSTPNSVLHGLVSVKRRKPFLLRGHISFFLAGNPDKIYCRYSFVSSICMVCLIVHTRFDGRVLKNAKGVSFSSPIGLITLSQATSLVSSTNFTVSWQETHSVITPSDNVAVVMSVSGISIIHGQTACGT